MDAYVEFMGPYGAGKTTVHDRSEFPRTLSINDVSSRHHLAQRHIRADAPKPVAFLYGVLPGRFGRYVSDEIVMHRFTYHAFKRFVQDFPDYLDTFSRGLDYAENEPDGAFVRLYETAGLYQLGRENVFPNETLSVDRGFIQLLSTLQWYSGIDFSKTFSREFLSTVPLPDLVFYIDAPVEVCLERQSTRNSVAVDKEWVSNHRDSQVKISTICETLADILREEGVQVIKIQNEDISNTVRKVQSELETFQ
ncbi:hypothetical protein [Natrarchaeobius chitinivorans]|uniref:Uncharacterized protein n=1 Tax=Natrarchaeobius chitinivorans TaxID=1679083 RepID=A0A3N6M9G0_NATCH|nr:hypothetical protein [Natrarchaeobius chitinivorans]RQG92061.1 hypothetical protein EA473_17530 [Natrarchaeobius chitinivorans]